MTVLDVRTGSTTPSPAVRRIRMSPAALGWLSDHLPGTPPPAVSGLTSAGLLDDSGSVQDELRAVGVMGEGGPEVVDAVRHTWSVLVSPRELVQVEVRGASGGRSAVLATSGDFGVGVVQVDASTVELSAWLRSGLRDELARLVPDADGMRGRPSISSALGGGAPVSADARPVDVTDGAGLPTPCGRVDVDVVVRTADGPAAGQVHWVCAGDRWWRLARRSAGVMAEPVAAHDLGADVFRLLTAAATWMPADRPTTGDASGDSAENGPRTASEPEATDRQGQVDVG